MRRLVLRRLLCLPVLAAFGLVFAQGSAAAEPPTPVELNDGWEFAQERGGPWKRVKIPHVIDARPAKELFPGTIGWYRLRFKGPATTSGHGWAVRFGGVRRRAEASLNGRKIGSNTDPYTPFTLPADGLRPGEENELVVRVDHRRTPGWREGWWNWGGITREVELVPRGRVSLQGAGVLSALDCNGSCRATAIVDGWVENHTAAPVRPVVDLRLAPPGDGPVTTGRVRMRVVQPGERARVHFRVPVRGEPRLWAPERPQLYRSTLDARLGNRVEDRRVDRVGLRNVRVRDGKLYLNERPLTLRGASIQEDMPGRGPALTAADVERIVADLKAVGANVTRAHYLLDERLLDRLDEEGILVWSQAPVYHRDVQLRTAAGRSQSLDSVRRTVLEARRHPSVITHSVANELSPQPDRNPTTGAWLNRARVLTEDLDPSVPASVDVLAWPGFPRQRTYAAFDLLGVNSYFGWYNGDEQHYTGNLDDFKPFLETMHAMYRRSALVVTEFGAEATMKGPADVKETFAFQTEYLRAKLGTIGDLPFMNGAIYWTLREFAVKPDWDGGAERVGVRRDGIHDKGLLEYETGERKPAWRVAREDFTSTPLYDAPMPPQIAAAIAEAPAAEAPSKLITGAIAILLTGLAALAALLVWLLRDAWKVAARGVAAGPPPDMSDELAERRRIRKAA